MKRSRMISCVIALTLFCSISNSQAQWVHTNGPWGAYIYRIMSVGQTTYAASQGSGVFRSSDDGHTWSEFPTAAGTSVYTMLAADGALYLGGMQGVAVSRDQGSTWETGLTAKIVQDLCVMDTSIIALTSAGVYVSGQNVIRWRSMSPKSAGFLSRCGAVRNSSLYVGTSTGLYRTDDNATTWSQLSTDNCTSVLIEGDTIYEGALAGMHVSYDHGTTWHAGTGASMGDTTIVYRVKRIQGKLFAATHVGPQVSFDNGATWSRMPGTLQQEVIYDMAVAGTSVVFGGSKGAFTSPDLRTWTVSNEGLSGVGATAVAASGNTLYGATWYENLKSTDNGRTWEHFAADGPDSYVNQIVIHGDAIYIADAGYGVFCSTNNGGSWSLKNTGLSSIKIWSLLPFGDWLIAGIYPDGSYRSSDKGESWELRDGFNGWGVTFATMGNMIWGAGAGKMGVSTDSGATWTSKSNGLPTTYMMSTASLGSRLFVAPRGSGVFVTSDNGDSWEPAGSSLPFSAVDLMHAHGNLLFAFSSSGVAVSSDSGQTWEDGSQGLPESQTYYSAVVSGSDLVVAADHGIYRRPLAQFTTLDAPAIHTEEIAISLAPNPTTNRVTLRGNVLRMATLRVCSATGEVVMRSVNRDLPIASLDLTSLPAGVYQVMIESNGRTVTRSIVRR